MGTGGSGGIVLISLIPVSGACRKTPPLDVLVQIQQFTHRGDLGAGWLGHFLWAFPRFVQE